MDLDVNLRRERGSPALYRQIADAIRHQIVSGQIRAGERLPPERQLAVELNVNRSTVVAAYDELTATGLVDGRVGAGTVVTAGAASELQGRNLPWDLLFSYSKEELSPWIREILASSYQPDMISFSASEPPPSLYPMQDLADAFSQVLANVGGDALRYSQTEGITPLRELLAARLEARGGRATAENVIVTAGAMQGIDLIAQCLTSAGDEVAIETPTYVGAIQAFRRRRVRLIGIPVDDDGMRVDLLERAIARRPIKAVFVTPNFSNPSGVVLSEERRQRLLSLTQRYQVPVIEDNVYGDIYFERPPPAPLITEREADHVIHVDSVSKVLFAGLRVGWVYGPQPVITQLALVKQYSDGFTATFSQWLLHRLIEMGTLDRQTARIRESNRGRRDHLLAALSKLAAGRLRTNEPRGGAFLWCRLPGEMKASDLLTQATRNGVSFVPGETFSVSGEHETYARLGYGLVPIEDVEEGIERLTRAMDAVEQRKRRVASPNGKAPLV